MHQSLSFWKRIKFKLLLFGMIMSIVPTSIFGWYNIQTAKMALEKGILERQLSVVQRSASEINHLLNSIKERMALVIDSNSTSDFSEETLMEWEKSLYGFLKQNVEIENAYVFDQSGNVIAEAQRLEIKSLQQIPPEQLEIIKSQEGTETDCFAGKVHFKGDGQPYVNICVPFYSSNQDIFYGGMLVEVNLRSTFKKISSIYTGKNGYIYIIDDQSRLIAHTDFSHVLSGKEVVQSTELKYMLEPKNLVVTPTRYQSYTGVEVIGAAAPISSTGWAVVAEQPVDQAYLSVNLLIQRLMMTTLAVVTFVVLVSIVFGVWFTRPIELMERAVRKVTQGKLEAKIDYPVQDEFGKLAEAFNHMTTELKEKSDHIEQEKERLDTIINGSGAGFALIDRNYKVEWMNHRLKEWVAKDHENLFCYHLFGDSGKPCEDCPIFLKDGKQCNHEMISTLSINDRTRIYRHRVYPLERTRDGLPQYLIMVEDITEQRQLEEMAIQADKLSALGILASGFAHEVNNPLASISAYAEDLKERMKEESIQELISSGEVDHYMDIIHHNVERCKTITGNLLHFSRKASSSLQEIQLNQLIDNTIILLQHELKKKQIQLNKRYEPFLPPVIGNAIQVQQVLVNMMQNAIDAMEQQGELELYTIQKESQIEIHIKDNGSGMTKEEIQKAFDPFYTTKPAGKGTGLGLYISYNIIKKLNGDIIIQSIKGAGTDVAIVIPAVKRDQEVV